MSDVVEGVEALERKLDDIGRSVRLAVLRALHEGVRAIAVDARNSMRATKVRWSEKGNYKASLPGYPPAIRTGYLHDSIVFGVDTTRLSGVVGTNASYGKYLEFGTRYMEPRPWLYPAYARNKRKILGALNSSIRNVLRRSGR